MFNSKHTYKINDLKSSVRPKPLKNTGANCYLNSTLQAISACDKFMNNVKNLYEYYGIELDTLATFYELICSLNDVSGKPMEISHNKIFQHWNKFGQQDCFELLSYILNQVYNQIKAYKVEKKDINIRNLDEWLSIPLPMRIIIDYKMCCDCGEMFQLPLQSDFALHITIPMKDDIDLQSAINDFFKNELIKDVECNRKGCFTKEVTKYTKLYFLPDTICIHLQKSHWNGSKLVKIKNKIRFIKDLRIYSEFLSSNTDNEEYINAEINKDVLLRNKTSNSYKNCRYAFPLISSISEELTQIQMANFEKEDYMFVNFKNLNSNYVNKSCENMEFLDNSKKKFDNSEKDDHIVTLSDAIKDVEKYKYNDHEILNSTTIDNKISFTNMSRKPGNNESLENFDFILKSVIVHKGSVNKGHYVCYKTINKQWFLANDSKISKVKEADVYNSEAYVLFYEKL